LVRAWAMDANRRERSAALSSSLRRLRMAVALVLGILLFLVSHAFSQTNPDAPSGKPEATIDLATKAGVDLVKGQWRYSDTKIIEVDFKAAGPDKQPPGAPTHTY